MHQAFYSEDKLTGSSRLGVNNSALVGKRLLGGAYKRNKSDGCTPLLLIIMKHKLSFLEHKQCQYTALLAVLLLIGLFMPSTAKAQYNLYVGQDEFIEVPDPPYDGYVRAAWWTKTDNITYKEQSVAGAIVYISHYFEDSEYITCTYNYSYYYRDREMSAQGQKTFTFSCIPVYATLSSEKLELTVGKKKKLTYNLSSQTNSSYASKNQKWTSSNENIATVDQKGNVEAKGEGTCKIWLDPAVGPMVCCEVTVTDGGGEQQTKLNLTCSPSGGEVAKGTVAKLSVTNASGAYIYYTLNGGTPTKDSTPYSSSGITINSSCTLKAVAYKEGYEDSDVLTANFTVKDDAKPKLVLSASPSGGQVSAGSTVTLTAKANGSTVSGCDIYYTLDGSTPTKNSRYYSSGITINSDCTLKAIAYKSGYEDSDVLATTYTTPKNKLVLTVSPSGGRYIEGPTITLTAKYGGNVISDADIYYTLNGTTPNRNSNRYSKQEKTIWTGSVFLSEWNSWSYGINSGESITTFRDADLKGGMKLRIYGYSNNNQPNVCLYDGSWQELKIEKKCLTSTDFTQGYFEVILTEEAVSQLSSSYTDWGGCLILLGDDFVVNKITILDMGITIKETCALKAIAYKDGYAASDVLSESYTIINTKGIQVIAGAEHSLVLKQNGTLWTCGHNDGGQVGDGSTSNRNAFVRILEDVDTAAIGSYGGGYTYALKKDGSLWTWGYNGEGIDGTWDDLLSPVKVVDNVKCFSICSNSKYAVKKDGSLWMWGEQMSDDRDNVKSMTDIYPPQKVMDNVDRVYAGDDCFMHILKKDGTLWGYGYNSSGQLGDGTRKTRLTPVKIMSDISSVIPGYAHTFAIKYDQSLWGWGFNPCGALGDGSQENRLLPIKICDNVKSVVSNIHSTFIIKNDNSLWVCGDNDFGQLGDGTKNEIHYPQKIMDGVKSVSCNGASSFILKTDGTLWGCGNDWCKMFVGEHLSPVKVAEDVILVSSQDSYILYVKSDGSVWACGDNSWGRLGTGTDKVWCYSPENVMEGLFMDSKIEILLSPSGYATFFSSESAYALPNGLSASVVTSATNGKLVYRIFADNVVPKGVPVLIENDMKEGGNYTLTATGSTTTYSGTNLLQGSDEETMTTGNGYHYKLSYGPSGTKWNDVFGWYWGATDGSSFQIEGHKAWLVVPISAATRGYTIDGDATDIVDIEQINDNNAPIYDMQGRRISAPTKSGIYIKNGKKIVIK